MINGPEMFCLYAQPPNLLGYCGPDSNDGVTAVAHGLSLPFEEVSRLALAFEGAWPYLELIGGLTRKDPLDLGVVEAYWLGNHLLGQVGTLDWGNSVSERFRRQAGNRWGSVVEGLNRGGLPNHAFHVFCVYPWVGLLREGFVGPSLEVLDRCRISWGRVTGIEGSLATVARRPLLWVDDALKEGEPIEEPFRVTPRHTPALGDDVALHWDFVCQRLDRDQLERLRRTHDKHLAIANRELWAARLEPAR